MNNSYVLQPGSTQPQVLLTKFGNKQGTFECYGVSFDRKTGVCFDASIGVHPSNDMFGIADKFDFNLQTSDLPLLAKIPDFVECHLKSATGPDAAISKRVFSGGSIQAPTKVKFKSHEEAQGSQLAMQPIIVAHVSQKRIKPWKLTQTRARFFVSVTLVTTLSQSYFTCTVSRIEAIRPLKPEERIDDADDLNAVAIIPDAVDFSDGDDEDEVTTSQRPSQPIATTDEPQVLATPASEQTAPNEPAKVVGVADSYDKDTEDDSDVVEVEIPIVQAATVNRSPQKLKFTPVQLASSQRGKARKRAQQLKMRRPTTGDPTTPKKKKRKKITRAGPATPKKKKSRKNKVPMARTQAKRSLVLEPDTSKYVSTTPFSVCPL